MAEKIKWTINTRIAIRDALNGEASPSQLRYLVSNGWAATMKDGRVVVTLPVRDEYFRSQRLRLHHERDGHGRMGRES